MSTSPSSNSSSSTSEQLISHYWVYGVADVNRPGGIEYRVVKGTEQEMQQWTSKMNPWAIAPVKAEFSDLTKRDWTKGYFKGQWTVLDY